MLLKIAPNWYNGIPDPDSDAIYFLPLAENLSSAIRSIDEISSFEGVKIDLTFSQIKDMGHSKEESTIPTKIGRQHDL